MKRLLLWVPAVAYMALIFFASSMPGDEVPAILWDKLEHLLAYAVLGILFLVPLTAGQLSKLTAMTGAVAVLLSTLYGVVDEVHQSFTPGRFPDVRDLFADALGAALGVAGVWLLGVIGARVRRRTKGSRL